MRPALQNAVIFVGTSLGARLDARGVFDDDAARRVLSERVRRDVWMFVQIVRAFAVKAKAVGNNGRERWAAISPLAFVREFLTYFRAMGYPLLRTADYPRVNAFLDPIRLAVAIDEAEQFYGFLNDLFEAIGHREELSGGASIGTLLREL